jgi:SET domain-containing protein
MKKPHDGVYTRIQASKIHGVGVFAIRNIKKGAYVFPGDDDELVWIKKNTLKNVAKRIKRLYEDFCVIKEKGKIYGCPKNFNQMTIAWYLNHSKKPNVGCDRNYNFFTLKNVKAGEELTADYDTYNEFSNSEPPRNP